MATTTPADSDHPTCELYEELLKRFREQLLRSVNPTELLLSALSQVEAFERKVSDVRSVKNQFTDERAEKVLLLPVDGNYEENIGHFLSILRQNGHAHVADVFTTGSGEGLLTEDNYQLLCRHLKALCEYLDPECGIVESLISEGVFIASDEEMVHWGETAYEKVKKIVDILLRKSNRSYECFIGSLQDNDQEHIVHILTEGREGSPQISLDDLKFMRKQRKIVLKNMESVHTSFVSTLVSMEVFTDHDRQRVEAKGKVSYERNEQILNILARKSRRHFDNFIEALNTTSQEHVAELFDALTISGTVIVKSSPKRFVEVETKLKSAFTKDLQDEESEISQELDDIGIHGADVESGSIKIKFKFLTRETLDEMQNGELDRIFIERYRMLFSDNGVTSFHIAIVDNEFQRCRELLKSRHKLMTPQHQEALKLAANKIADKISVDKDMLDDLALCSHRQDAILNQKSGEDKVTVLLEVMACRPDCEFQRFVDALRKTKQNDAANYVGKNIR